MQETIFCYKCGKEILKDAEICPNCGCRQNNTLCNTWLITLLLCFFLGSFGAHRFYLKKNASAITMLILTLTIFGTFITSIWCIIDLIIIICGNFTDANNNKIKPL